MNPDLQHSLHYGDRLAGAGGAEDYVGQGPGLAPEDVGHGLLLLVVEPGVNPVDPDVLVHLGRPQVDHLGKEDPGSELPVAQLHSLVLPPELGPEVGF